LDELAASMFKAYVVKKRSLARTDPDDGGTKLLLNVANILSTDMTSHPRLESSLKQWLEKNNCSSTLV